MLQFPIFKTRQDLPTLFFRPPLQLRSLPIESRWEVTRRHPSYFVYWKLGDLKSEFDDERQGEEAQAVIAASRLIALNAIGIPPEEAVDPATEFSDLGELNLAWKSGAVHPTSMRGLASLFVSLLPPETLAALGYAFIEGSCEDDLDGEDDKLTLPNKIKALNKIAAMDKPGLDHLMPEPNVSINPWASGRQVNREIKLLLNQWKEELDLSEFRERSDKHNIYFDVWDRREGWEAGRYHSGRGKRFAKIAEQLERPLTTVHTQYKKAFELITGHPYRFDSFIELFGLIRFSKLLSDGRDSKYRRFKDSKKRPVPESTIGIPLDAVAQGINERREKSPYTMAEFIADVKSSFREELVEFGISSGIGGRGYGLVQSATRTPRHAIVATFSLSARVIP